MILKSTCLAAAFASGLSIGAMAAPVDPGPRSGSQVGGPLPSLSAEQAASFDAGRAVFQEIDTVPGGLGPRFNADSCAACHAHPAIGGTSPAVNPQIATATAHGATNTIPSFVTRNGPVREARFIYAQPPKGNGKGQLKKGDLDGGVKPLFTITGRTDAAGCNISQPDFPAALAANNVIFRIPTPVFGLGLVENIPDSVLVANAVISDALGISPHFNRSGNDGTITRFGWKAQNKSLLMFAGEAYNVEQGVTNALFPTEREEDSGCQYNATFEDDNFDISRQADFMRLSAPPTPFPPTASTVRGKQVFGSVGCVACHVPKQTTQTGVEFAPYSDFAVHPMGEQLADGITQGNAGPDEFRTAPLWGTSQRLFFLHDGRTKDLLEAILTHDSKGSQASIVTKQFRGLADSDKQAILDFLRSL